mmetsp:Transcript_27148/g.26193  ORF Transcript_27148/g.26193 Transcript_27148/m.26193 type:complete len:105 (+) Transcript_27148:399-713(+)
MLLLGTTTYGVYSMRKSMNRTESRPVMGPEIKKQTIKEQLMDSVSDQALDILSSETIKKEGMSFLNSLFQQKEVHDSLLKLVNNDIREKEFIEESRKLGIDLAN